ncbi:MAG: hypothetical protein M3N93_14140 [Acidobacteriota bacterium]|nr:hypothetical protein [Acidobacteriota bacterium]
MRLPILILLSLVGIQVCSAQPRIDNVLERMVPPGATSLVGARMDLIRQTEIYRKMLAGRRLGQADTFTAETGFDPRRDVKELLYVSTAHGGVMLARGTFHLHGERMKGAKKTRYRGYEIIGERTGGFCLLDATLAVAGDLRAIEAALDEWKSGTGTSAQALIARLGGVNPSSQFWGVSSGAGNFLAEHPLGLSSGIDFSKIFRGLQDTWFQADFSAGLKAEVHGVTASEKDAANLRDAVRGMVGLGRLNVPENEPDLLPVWDGITVEQTGRSISMRADIAQGLIDKMVTMLAGVSGTYRRLL